MADQAFPLEKIPDIESTPEDFRLLERVPLTRQGVTFPVDVNPAVGDEQPLLVVDVETTGLDAQQERVIELGMVRATYSPSAQRITSIQEAHSHYEDPTRLIHALPSRSISPLITEITGIRSEDVEGHEIDDGWVAMMTEGDPLVLAHNAGFDAAFLATRFTSFDELRWGCTMGEIPWRDMGFESRGLQYLLLRMGWFYAGHRASIDCLATIWMLAERTDAFARLLDRMAQRTVVIRAFGAPFEVKDQLKANGYSWHAGDAGSNKCWWKEVPEHDLEAEQAALNELYRNGAERAGYQYRDARTRFRNPVT